MGTAEIEHKVASLFEHVEDAVGARRVDAIARTNENRSHAVSAVGNGIRVP